MSTSGAVGDQYERVTQGQDESVVDVVDIIQKRPRLYWLVVVATITYWGGIVSLSLIAVQNLVGFENGGYIVDFGWNTGAVTCKDGTPTSWKMGALIFFVVCIALELYVALQTTMGKALVQAKKFKVLECLGLGFFGRYDPFTDICFSLTANACGSRIGLASIVIFFIGVLLAQVVPALWMLLRANQVHLALKFNDLLLLLEIIDPTRGELELPEAARKQMVGDLPKLGDTVSGLGTVAPNAADTSANQDARAPQRTPEEIAAIKAEIELLTDEEAANEQADDPDEVKKKALIARAKWVQGGLRFLCEDLLQGILQVLFMLEHWGELSSSTRAFIISSVVAGVAVSLGGPVYAFWLERQNKSFYSNMPKIQGNTEWKGVQTGEGVLSGVHYQCWEINKLQFNEVQAQPGQTSITVRGTILREEILKEGDGEPTYNDRMPSFMEDYLSYYGAAEDTVEGTYDVKHAMLRIKTTSQKMLKIARGTSFNQYEYELKVFPDRLKGTIRKQGSQSDMGMITLKRQF